MKSLRDEDFILWYFKSNQQQCIVESEIISNFYHYYNLFDSFQ